MSSAALQLDGIGKTFRQAGRELPVLRGLDLDLQPGEMVALLGPSGSGKSTLLHICGLLERPDQGVIRIAGTEAQRLGDRERTRLRREQIGFVYQYHHLLPEFSALENLVVPQMIAGLSRREATTRALELLEMVGLTERTTHRPASLSGGEQQRVAIARALVNAPKLLLADEPTGNLDPHTADTVFALLVKLVRGAGLAALLATHNYELAARMDRIVRLEEGHLVGGLPAE
ncbi:ABC transporter ATP-binding protein [Algihabitans albus]|uniref:ABC transporter ATP-binding protein n=1 Tax=Algihabitans albus TaxID=2164067 RepID=UPI000E5D91D5|nr:ABC transporter ATP-binding protein [Algihabitans albus]